MSTWRKSICFALSSALLAVLPSLTFGGDNTTVVSPNTTPGDSVFKGKAVKSSNAAAGTQYAVLRQAMVANLRKLGIKDERVLAAMGAIERHRFVPDNRKSRAYDDLALQIGSDQTISAPHIVARMTELVHPSPAKKALDIGTGSGYQAAVLSSVCKEVYSIEIVKPLAAAAKTRLTSLGYQNITTRCGDGYRGWAEHAPFDIIVVAAAPDKIPQPLIDQLATNGRMVIPVGGESQKLVLIEKKPDGAIVRSEVSACMFVPMTGEAKSKKPAAKHES